MERRRGRLVVLAIPEYDNDPNERCHHGPFQISLHENNERSKLLPLFVFAVADAYSSRTIFTSGPILTSVASTGRNSGSIEPAASGTCNLPPSYAVFIQRSFSLQQPWMFVCSSSPFLADTDGCLVQLPSLPIPGSFRVLVSSCQLTAHQQPDICNWNTQLSWHEHVCEGNPSPSMMTNE
jgi:hypothetical protein